ncbi:three-Cys-motif partner protein TcmP [Larkinella ripae]
MDVRDDFFEAPTEVSKTKTEIVRKYFWAWANVIIAKSQQETLAYVDLFSGTGKYESGDKSTPIHIIEGAIRNPKISQRLITIFNDSNPKHTEALTKAISEIESVDTLRYQPQIWNEKVGDELAAEFGKYKIIPTLLFVDPFGYKGLSLKLIGNILKDWGCDCIFFFNYNRINMILNNPVLHKNSNPIFGDDIIVELKEKVKGLHPVKREELILLTMQDALKSIGGKYSIYFKFYKKDGVKTSHFVFFVSKNQLAYTMMKSIMAKESNFEIGQISSYSYNPNQKKIHRLQTLFPKYSFDDLWKEILKKHSGQAVKCIDIYYEAHCGTNYSPTDYKNALVYLEKNGYITCNKPLEKRKRKDSFTCSDELIFTFP